MGRTKEAKSLDENAVTLAVIAHIRHAETNYDELLSLNTRQEAREIIRDKLQNILSLWGTK
ncbi:MAG: DUF2293 domain-containing protein [Desulfobacterales bacterium]|nr:DUF2293 domain-containing protein [Desulfobacterales bacterium]